MSAYGAASGTIAEVGPRQPSAGVKRLALIYVWITIASIAITISDPAPFDALSLGAILLLPVVGLTRFVAGLGLYILLWAAIVAASFIASTQAVDISVPANHIGITFFLALWSIVMAAFITDRPRENMRLIMSAYMVSAVIAATAGLIGYFGLLPGAYDIFTEYGRARGTFQDPNVLGAFLVPALLYAFNTVMRDGLIRSWLSALCMPILLFGSILTFSRGAWINLGVSLAVYAFFTFGTAATNRQRLKLMIYVAMAGVFALGVLAAAQSIPKVAELMGERASFEQSYDVGPEGRFGGQMKAIGLILTHPLGIGALEFHSRYHHEDVHEVYLSMYLNGGWIGGTLYLAAVLLTLMLGLRQVIHDRGGDGVNAVLVAAFFGMALEGLVIDTDHWRHFYLLMAMVWGVVLASSVQLPAALRERIGR